jgi:methionyl-tRNA formyltransferase
VRFAVAGRTELLLDSAKALLQHGHELTAVFTAPAMPHYLAGETEFEELAQSVNVPHRSDGLIGAAELDTVVASGTEVLVSVNWPRRLDDNILGMFPFGGLNAHAGDLPRYRGNACLNWAILNGEPQVAIVVHRMLSQRIDDGPILVRRRRQVSDADDIGDLYAWLRHEVPTMYVEALPLLADPTMSYLTPGEGPPLRCYPRTPEDARICWDQSAVDIGRLVRASSRPFDGAFAMLGECRLTIWKAAVASSPPWGDICAMPGQVVRGPGAQIGVACGTGVLVLEDYAFGCGQSRLEHSLGGVRLR